MNSVSATSQRGGVGRPLKEPDEGVRDLLDSDAAGANY